MRVLLVVNALLEERRKREIAAGTYPRRDYIEWQSALGADIIDLGALDRRWWTRLVQRIAGGPVAQALLAWRVANSYDAIFTDRESVGFALAVLSKLRVRRPRLVVLAHFLSPLKKKLLWRLFRLQGAIDLVIVHASSQRNLARNSLGLRADQVALVPYHADERFWYPRDEPVRHQICSAGLEFRDYSTMVAAVSDIEVDVVIAAASFFSKHRGLSGDQPLPPNVRVVSCDYAALRRLYAESLFVVVPLRDVENQAGITTILEAMAMGKAVVVSHTRGQVDVVRDRRGHNRVDPHRPTQPDWARTLGATASTAQGQTGIYVQPYDPAELRRAIQFLIDHPEQARLMGANGRRLIEETMGLDHFTTRVATLITGDIPAGQAREQPRIRLVR